MLNDFFKSKSNDLELGTVDLGSVNHVGKLSLGLVPLSGLQTTVRVDPKVLLRVNLENVVDAALELVLGRNTRRVDIKETKTNVVGVVGELLNVLGVILLGELNRDNISIKSLDVSRVKIRVAEMRVDLGTVLNTRGGETERKRSPLDVLITLLTLTEGKTLTDGRLVDLDDLNVGLLKIVDLISKSEGELERLVLGRNIVSGERPSQNGDGTSKHTLHGLVSKRLSVLRLLDSHGSRTRDITDNDGGSNVSGAVRLDPTVGSESETLESLTEVLNHIVSLGLTVNKDIEANLLLELDDLLDLLLNELLVLFSSDLTLGELVSVDTDLLGLGERTNGGGGEQRKVEALLGSKTLGEGSLSLGVSLSDGSKSLSDLGVNSDLRDSTSLNGLLVGSKSIGNRLRTVSHSLSNDNDLSDLLGGKREPVLDDGVELLLVVEIDRGVEKRRGGGDNNSVSTNLGLGALNELNGLGEVSLPNVTAVNDTNRKNLLLSKSLNSSIELLRDTNKVVVETSNGETLDGINVRAGITEVRGDQKLGETGLSGEELVGSLEGSLELLRKVKNKDGLINLDRLGTGSSKLGKNLSVDGEELGEESDQVKVKRVLVSLTEKKVRDGTNENGAGLNAELLGLKVLVNGLLAVQLELSRVGEGRTDVVVVGVKPLDHLEGGDIDGRGGLGSSTLETTAHGKEGVNGGEGVLRVSLGDNVEEEREIKNVIVKGEVVGGNDVDTSVLLELPVVGTEVLTGLDELVGGSLTAPVGFSNFLELTLSTDTGETENRRQNHC